jgi:hypothetical protein
VPRLERLYFHFAEPIETRYLVGREHDPAVCFALRERVRRTVEEGITRLLLERARDPDRALAARVLHRVGHPAPSAEARPPRSDAGARILPRAV